VIWYLTMWVAAYLAILHKFDPADTSVYEEARANDLQLVSEEDSEEWQKY